MLWSLAGLLHDLDLEKTKEPGQSHISTIQDSGRTRHRPIKVIQGHNAEINRESKLIFLAAAETVTDLIITTALHPEK